MHHVFKHVSVNASSVFSFNIVFNKRALRCNEYTVFYYM